MDALEFRMEKIINHIISTTYPDKHFARLHVVFLRKDTKSFHGTYDPKKQLARIGNLSRSPAHIIATLLHEAAYHCELLLSGQTGHQRSFYLIYHDLMVSAIRMGLLSYEAVKDVSDSASIRQLERYFGPITETADPTFRYLPGKALLYAFNGFSHKDTLKPRGYHYNSRAKAWERVIDRSALKDELSFLRSLPGIIPYATDDFLDLTVLASIVVSGDTYSKKDILRSLNFSYRKKLPGTDHSGWIKYVRSEEIPDYKNAIQILQGTPGILVKVRY